MDHCKTIPFFFFLWYFSFLMSLIIFQYPYILACIICYRLCHRFNLFLNYYKIYDWFYMISLTFSLLCCWDLIHRFKLNLFSLISICWDIIHFIIFVQIWFQATWKLFLFMCFIHFFVLHMFGLACVDQTNSKWNSSHLTVFWLIIEEGRFGPNIKPQQVKVRFFLKVGMIVVLFCLHNIMPFTQNIKLTFFFRCFLLTILGICVQS